MYTTSGANEDLERSVQGHIRSKSSELSTAFAGK